MLASMTSKQIAEWLAFAKLEQIGEPVPPDPEQAQKNKNKMQRDKLEGGLMALRDKRG